MMKNIMVLVVILIIVTLMPLFVVKSTADEYLDLEMQKEWSVDWVKSFDHLKVMQFSIKKKKIMSFTKRQKVSFREDLFFEFSWEFWDCKSAKAYYEGRGESAILSIVCRNPAEI